MLIRILLVLALVVALGVAGAYFYFSFFFEEPVLVSPGQTDLQGVKIQPAEALVLAEPYIEAHGSEERRGGQGQQTAMARFKGWYYVKRTDYPFKNAGYLLQSAVKVHEQTGEVGFSAD